MLASKIETTRGAYEKKARVVCQYLDPHGDIHDLTREQLFGYIAAREATGVTRHTIHKELVVIRQALKEARKREVYRGSLDIVPAYKAKYEPRKRFLTREEVEKLLAELTEEQRLWVQICIYTGAERSVMHKLCWDDIDFKRNQIHLRGTKRATRDRHVPIAKPLRQILEKLDRSRPLLPTQWERVNGHLGEACERAGLKRVSPNDLRRTFGSWLKQEGVDSLTVAHMMGHSGTYMVNKVYGQLDEATYQAAMEKLK